MVRPIVEALLALCYPSVCGVCGSSLVEGERVMCLKCRLSLPLTGFESNFLWNPMMEKLVSLRGPVERCAAYFYYQSHAPHSRLVHLFKYNEKTRIGRDLIGEYARRLQSAGFFDGIDAMAPVPLSRGKLIRRGYNQSFQLARGGREVVPLPVIEALKAARHGSQTRLDARLRMENARGVYSAVARNLDGVGHLLLIDDIVTTGATVCACVEALRAARPRMKVSVLALATPRMV